MRFEWFGDGRWTRLISRGVWLVLKDRFADASPGISIQDAETASGVVRHSFAEKLPDEFDLF